MASSQERVDTHGASSQDDPARTPPSWNRLKSMHKANRYGIETTTLRRLLPVDAHSARPFTWNNDSEVRRTQATRHLSAVLLSGQPSPWRCPLGSVTDLSSTAQ